MDLEQALQSVEQQMMAVVESDVQVLRDASRHILAAGGKRMRPRLTLLAYLAVGGAHMEEAVPVAAAVELVHTATLVHDDINDHGLMRRGRQTVNAIWGRTFALLTGDFLFTKVYELMAPYKDLNTVFAGMTVALVEGETLQAQAAKSGELSREVYAQVIARKTARLFSGAARMGAMLGGGSPEQVTALEQYAFNLGLAFQIVDDILDLVADSNTLGKTAGIDMAQGKGLATALANAGQAGQGGGARVQSRPRQTGAATAVLEADPTVALKQKLLAGNYIEEGRANAQQLLTLALLQLQALPASGARAELESLARRAVERDH